MNPMERLKSLFIRTEPERSPQEEVVIPRREIEYVPDDISCRELSRQVNDDKKRLEDMGFNWRAINALARATRPGKPRYTSPETLNQLTDDEILAVRVIGRVSLAHIRDCLSKHEQSR